MTAILINHPLVAHKIGLLREKTISMKSFRELVAEITTLLCYEACRDMTVSKEEIECWSGPVTVERVANKQPTFVPILRAGLGMLNGALAIVPSAKVSVVGFKRNEETLDAEVYYENLVNDIDQRQAIIIDPMLATGGTLDSTISLLKQSGCRDIKCLILVAAPEGIARIEAQHPEVDIYTAAIDQKLNDKGYILPGLGDAGDKIFGTL